MANILRLFVVSDIDLWKRNDDGVVKSPIYFALVFGQTFDVPYVLLQAWPSTKSCIWNLFLSHLYTFYESIYDEKK